MLVKGGKIMEQVLYKLELPMELYDLLCDLAEQNGITVEEQLSQCCQAVLEKLKRNGGISTI